MTTDPFYMYKAMSRLNADMILLLVSSGGPIDGYTAENLPRAIAEFLDDMSEEEQLTEIEHIKAYLFPIVTKLRRRFPQKVSAHAARHLLVNHPELDEEGEMSNSDNEG